MQEVEAELSDTPPCSDLLSVIGTDEAGISPQSRYFVQSASIFEKKSSLLFVLCFGFVCEF